MILLHDVLKTQYRTHAHHILYYIVISHITRGYWLNHLILFYTYQNIFNCVCVCVRECACVCSAQCTYCIQLYTSFNFPKRW